VARAGNKRNKCEAGWVASAGACYTVDSIGTKFGSTAVTGRIKSPRAAPRGIGVTATVYANGGVGCVAELVVQGVEKNTEASFEAFCISEVQNPERTTVKLTFF